MIAVVGLGPTELIIILLILLMILAPVLIVGTVVWYFLIYKPRNQQQHKIDELQKVIKDRKDWESQRLGGRDEKEHRKNLENEIEQEILAYRHSAKEQKIEKDPEEEKEPEILARQQLLEEERQKQVFCTQCGKKNSLESNFCSNCGTSVVKS